MELPDGSVRAVVRGVRRILFREFLPQPGESVPVTPKRIPPVRRGAAARVPGANVPLRVSAPLPASKRAGNQAPQVC